MLAEAEAGSALPIEVTAAFAIALAIAALLGRRRMPAGLAEGTLVAAVSGVAILLLAVDSAGDFARAALGHVLTGLTLLWYALSRIAARRPAWGPPAPESPELGDSHSQRNLVWACAALACAFAAVANAVTRPGGLMAEGWRAGATDLVVLLVLSVLVWVLQKGAWTAYPAIALLACLVVSLAPTEGLQAHAPRWGLGLNAVALLCLLVVIVTILLDWQRRRRWLREPERLTEPPPARNVRSAVLVGVCLLLGLGGLLFRESWFAPTAVWLAALACLVIGHLRTWRFAGEMGLVLVALGIVSASMAWLAPGWSGALFGLGLAGGYLLWLARFWNQQLNAGQAWTTAGRLIPASRRLGYTALSGALVPAMGIIATDGLAAQTPWMTGVTLLLLLGGVDLLVRDGFEYRQPAAGVAACLLILAASGAGWALLTRGLDTVMLPYVAIPAGALLLVLRVAVVAPRSLPIGQLDPSDRAAAGPGQHVSLGRTLCVYVAYVGGALPVATLFVMSCHGLTGQTATALLLTAAAVVPGAMVLNGLTRTERADEHGPA